MCHLPLAKTSYKMTWKLNLGIDFPTQMCMAGNVEHHTRKFILMLHCVFSVKLKVNSIDLRVVVYTLVTTRVQVPLVIVSAVETS